jgi:hypothetical protein
MFAGATGIRKVGLFVLLVLLQSAHPSIAAPSPHVLVQSKMPTIDNLKPTLTTPPTSTVLLGSLKLEFERTTLTEIRKAVGVGEIGHRGDAGDSEYWLCYSISSRRRAERIWISSGELGGDEHVMDGFYVEPIQGTNKALRQCPALPVRFRPVSLENSLWLGANTAQLQARFGEPSARIDGWLLYAYLGKVPANGLDQIATLSVRVSGGKVTGLSMRQVSTD